MKKLFVCSIVLLLSLSGCKDKDKTKTKSKSKKMSKQLDVFSPVDIPMPEDNADMTDEEASVLSFFDESMDEFASPEEEYNLALADGEDEETATGFAVNDYSWVEADQDDDFKTLYFGFNKYGVSKDQDDYIDKNAQHLKDELKIAERTGSDATVVLEGHSCHSAGVPDYNLALSEKRAAYIADRLAANGIDRDKIKVVGRGQEVPVMKEGKIVTGSKNEQWPNRRVETRVIYS